MNNEDAKFILGAYRPDGRDAADPIFRDALNQAEADPSLRRWFERARGVDRSVSAKLASIAPPAGLREAILTGARASRHRTRPWNEHPLLMAAAVLLLLGVLTWSVRDTTQPDSNDLAELAVHDLANAHGRHTGHPAGLAAVQAQLATSPLPLTAGTIIDVEQLRRARCRTVALGGREVFELCFQRDGRWFHLYAAPRSEFAPEAIAAATRTLTQGRFAAATWADQENVYALVTSGPPEALRPLI